ncbi:MAG TPA: cyclic-di-AMP receptor [Chloroflexota bacterium]|nr:cyclic-di-AMP receptor [Chloroflexota bacterium]
MVAIVPDQDAGPIIDALVQQEYRSTRINTVGGFLKRGNATLLVGVEDDQVEDVKRIMRENSRPRSEEATPSGAGAIFVLNVSRFIHM